MTGSTGWTRRSPLGFFALVWLALACLALAWVAATPAAASEIEFSTFLGGAKDDLARGIARTPDGGTVIVGVTGSPDFPTVRAFQSASTDKGPFRISDGFVVKLDPSGTAIEFASFLGGSARDNVTSLTVDPSGNIYVGGWTDSLDFPVVGGLDVEPGNFTGFLTKISPDGQEILFSTLMGAIPDTIAFERNGRVFIAGQDFWGSFFLGSGPGSAAPTPYPFSAFVASIDTLNARVSKFAFVGVTDNQRVTHLGWDSKRNVLWAAGTTDSSDFPLLRPVREVSRFKVGDDGFGTGFLLRFKVTPDQLRLKSSSLLPGPLQALAIDRKGRPHVVVGSDDQVITGWDDVIGTRNVEGKCFDESYYLRIQASGRQLQNVQCPAIFFVTDLAVDRQGRVVLAGSSSDIGGAPLVDPVQTTTGGAPSPDIYVAVLTKGATRTLFGTYLGGRGTEFISDLEGSGGLAISASGEEILLAGWTTSRNFPVVAPIQPEKIGGGRRSDAFVTKLRPFD